MAMLRNWRVDTNGGEMEISGEVYGHPYKSDGAYIRETIINKRHRKIETDQMEYILIDSWEELATIDYPPY